MSAMSWLSVASVTALCASMALAQGGPGPGMGGGPHMPGPIASAPGMGPGGGPRAGRAGGARWGAEFTPGWALMTEAERSTHRERLRSMTRVDECQAYMARQHEQMAARARERGTTLPTPRRDACAGLAR